MFIKADTHEGFCSRSKLQEHTPGAKLLRVYQRFHGYASSSGAEFPRRKMLHDIKPVKYLGASSRGKSSELENAPSCVLTRAKWAWSMLREQNPSCVSALREKSWPLSPNQQCLRMLLLSRIALAHALIVLPWPSWPGWVCRSVYKEKSWPG